MSLTRRNGFVWTKATSGSNVQVGEGYLITVTAPGGVASASSTGATITMAGGHGFVVGDKLMIGTDVSTYSGIYSVQSISATAITMTGGTYNVAAGDTLVNLGPDGRVDQPNWDSSRVVIYADPAGATTIDSSEVTSNVGGVYGYWHDGQNDLWELVRTSVGVPIEVIVEAYKNEHTRRYAHLYATGGDGSSRATAWTGWEDAVEGATSGDVVEFIGGFFNIKSGGVTVPSNVALVGANRGHAGSLSSGGTTIKCVDGFTGAMFTTATDSFGNRFEQLLIDGSYGANVPIATNGIVIDGCNRAQIYDCDLRIFLGSAVKVTKSGGTTRPGTFRMLGCYITNAVQGSGLTERTGALHFTHGSEPYIEDCWIGCANSSTYNESGNQCGIAMLPASAGDTGGFTMVHVTTEYCETGIYVGPNTGSGWRAFHSGVGPCRGHGWYIDGAGGHLIGCGVRNAGNQTNNTYDGFYLTSNANNINLTSCIADWNSGNKHRYGFNDNGGAGGVNYFIGCTSFNAVTGIYVNNHAVTKQSIWLGDRLVSGAFRFVLGSSHIGIGRGVDEGIIFSFDGSTDDGSLAYRADQAAGVSRRFIFDKNAEATTLHASGDAGGIAAINSLTGVTDTPTADPGWATSSTVNMTAPNGYIKMYVGTQAVVVPYWNT